MREIKCVFLRHGKTLGNLEKRYIGSGTDEELINEGVFELSKIDFDAEDFGVSKVYVSPMIRCRQSASILWPDSSFEIVEDFKEIDFGDFEGKNYLELSDNPDYQAWIDSNGEMPFPNGEKKSDFIERNYEAFKEIVFSDQKNDRFAFVFHGGSIMAILSRLTGKDYYDFQVPCGQGYEVIMNLGEDRIDVVSFERIFARGNT